jgi:2-polyprenyl-6-methoxyphenol hydroxylase-like FAD-dependent oxidoreductase
VIDRTRARHLGLLYPDLIQAARGEVPATVQRIIGRVVDIKTGPQRQELGLQDGTSISARLVILATGMGDLLRNKLGIERRMIVAQQSLSFGFMLRPRTTGSFGFEALTSYGERPADALDYLSLFPTRTGMRANLFTFLVPGDERVNALRRDMPRALLAAMPGLRRHLGAFDVIDKVQSWLMDLTVADNVRQDGVVLIGDAYQTSCPAAGRGVSRLLSDVELLCRDYVPRWFETDRMGAEKISGFYADPRKQAMDQSALALSHYRRDLAVARGMRWEIRRRQHFMRRRFVGWLDGMNPALVANLKSWRRGGVSRQQPTGSAAQH